MSDEKHGGGLDGLVGKGEDALGKFMEDPEKVQKAKDKAEGFLGKYMDQEQAGKVTDSVEGLLGKVAHKPTESGERDQ